MNGLTQCEKYHFYYIIPVHRGCTHDLTTLNVTLQIEWYFKNIWREMVKPYKTNNFQSNIFWDTIVYGFNLIWSAKGFALQLWWRVFVLLWICSFKHSNIVADTKQDIYLKDFILALSLGARKYRKLNACKNTSYTVLYCDDISICVRSCLHSRWEWDWERRQMLTL